MTFKNMGQMISNFENWKQGYTSKTEKLLNEDFKSNDLEKVLNLIKSYLTKKHNVVSYSESINNFKQNGNLKLFGIRFLDNNANVFRFNWKLNPEINSTSIHSVDFWVNLTSEDDGTPTFKLNTEKLNIVQILALVEIILKNENRTVDEDEFLNAYLDADDFVNGTDEKEDLPLDESLNENKKYLTEEENGEYLNLKKISIGNLTKNERLRYGYLKLKSEGLGDITNQVLKFEEVESEVNIDSEEVRRLKEFSEKLNADVNIQQKFKDLKFLISSVANSFKYSLIITGTAGVGKTFTVTKTLEDLGLKEERDWVLIAGNASPKGMYEEFYHRRDDKIIVYDDCDSVFRNEAGLNILKGALDTKPTRTLSWKSSSTFSAEGKTEEEIQKLVKKGNYPDSFKMTSTCIFITNLNKNDLINDYRMAALLSRSSLIDMTFTQEEIVERIKEVIPNMHIRGLSTEGKYEVFEFLLNASKTGSFKKPINFRTFLSMCETKVSMEIQRIECEKNNVPYTFKEDDWIRISVTYS